MTDLNAIAQRNYETVLRRFDEVDTELTLKHCATEVVEATIAYNEWSFFDNKKKRKEEFENELADIILCVLTCAAEEHIDIEKAIHRKLDYNERRTD